MGTRNPKTRHANQLYLDEIPALRKALLSDPTSRAAYDAELAVAHRVERDRKLDELQRRVRLRAAKGGLGLTDRGLLIDEATRLGLNENDLVRIIRPIPNLIEAPSVNGDAELDLDPPADVLDPSTRRQIRMALEHLGCRDLYDALGLTRDAPASDINARADAERQRWMKKAQVTAEKTAWLEVITHAQSHLGSPRTRTRYDRTLNQEGEEAFDILAEFTLKGLKRLDPGTRAALVEEAGALGIAPDRADRLIGRICRRLGVAREAGSVPPLPSSGLASNPNATAPANGTPRFTLLRCRNCGGVTELSPVARKAASARCPHCGASLRWDCPVCRRTPWVDEPQCPCGFRMALREPVIRHFEAAQQAFRTFDLTGSLEHLERVLELAPTFPGARNGMTRVRQRQADIARVKLAYETARAGGKLAAARAAVEAWSRLVDPRSAEVQAAWADLTPGLRRAAALAARARKLERTDPPTARNLYLQCLDIAADLPDALSGLARTPPDPPTAMDAQVLGDRIRLIWTPPPPDGLGPLTFVLLRKRNGVLQHPADGTRIAEVNTCEFDDTLVTPGETVGYAVLSRRGGVDSVAAVSLASPVVFLADVKDVRIELREHEVELTWSCPRGVSEARVIRKRGGPPASPRDGDRIASAADHAIVPNSDRRQDDHYGIYAVYKMPDGRLFPSPGIVVTARPQPTVVAPEAPRLLQEPTGRVRIDWIEPARGSVRILRTSRPLSVSVGSRLNGDETQGARRTLDRAGRTRSCLRPRSAARGILLLHANPRLGRHLDRRSRRGPHPGPGPVRVAPPAPGSGLGSTVGGGVRVTLRWRWPAEASSAWIVARQARLPRDPAIPSRPPRSSPAPITSARTAGRSACRRSRPAAPAARPRPREATATASDPCHRTSAPGRSGSTAWPSATESAWSLRAWSRPPPRSCPGRIRKSRSPTA